MDNNKKWPVDQFLEWLNFCDRKYVNLSSIEAITTIAILKFANNQTWVSYPSVQTIANITQRDKKDVEDTLKALIKKKIFKIKKRYTPNGDRDSNEYLFIVDNLFKVGGNCPLRWGGISPYGRGGIPPVTTKGTTKGTKKIEDSVSQEKKKRTAPSDFSKNMSRQVAEFTKPFLPKGDKK